MRALLAALRGLSWVARERRVVPLRVEHALRLLERTASRNVTAGWAPFRLDPPA